MKMEDIKPGSPSIGERIGRGGTAIGSGTLSALGRLIGTVKSRGKLPRIGPDGQILYDTGEDSTPFAMGDAVMGPANMSERSLRHETKHSKQGEEEGLSFLLPWERPRQEIEAIEAEGEYTGPSPQYDELYNKQLGLVKMLNRDWAKAHPDFADYEASQAAKQHWQDIQNERMRPFRK